MQTLLTGDYKLTALQKELDAELLPVAKKKFRASEKDEKKAKRLKGCPKTSTSDDVKTYVASSGGDTNDTANFFAAFCKRDDVNKEDNLADLPPHRLVQLLSQRTELVEPLWPEQQLMLMKIVDEFTKTDEPTEEDMERYYYYISVCLFSVRNRIWKIFDVRLAN